MFSKKINRGSNVKFFEALEGRQMLSAVPMEYPAMNMAEIRMPAKPAPKVHVGPKVHDGMAKFTGSTNGTDPNGRPVTDALTVILTQNANGTWSGEVQVFSNDMSKVTSHGHVTLDANGNITMYESDKTGETIVVTGQASSDWTTISGTYTGSNTQGQTWGGSFSLTRA